MLQVDEQDIWKITPNIGKLNTILQNNKKKF